MINEEGPNAEFHKFNQSHCRKLGTATSRTKTKARTLNIACFKFGHTANLGKIARDFIAFH